MSKTISNNLSKPCRKLSNNFSVYDLIFACLTTLVTKGTMKNDDLLWSSLNVQPNGVAQIINGFTEHIAGSPNKAGPLIFYSSHLNNCWLYRLLYKRRWKVLSKGVKRLICCLYLMVRSWSMFIDFIDIWGIFSFV